MVRIPIRNLAGATLLIATILNSAAHACPQSRPDGELIIGVRADAEPFTNFDGTRPTGFNVELWERVAAFMFVPGENVAVPRFVIEGENGELRAPNVNTIRCDTIKGTERALQQGWIDVAISPLTITALRMESYDFSQPYISSGLSVAVVAQSAINFETAGRIISETLFSSSVALAVLGFLSLNLIVAFLIRWLLFSPEDRKAGGVFGAWVRAGLEALIRTVGLRGVADTYHGAIAKMFEIFLAIVGTALSATILGVLTSAFVGSMGQQSRIAAVQLPQDRVATLYCSTAQEMLKEEYKARLTSISGTDPRRAALENRVQKLDCKSADEQETPPLIDPIEGYAGQVTLTGSWSDAMQLLADGTVDRVLGDWVALTYLSRDTFSGRVDVLPEFYRNEPYGWGISRNSPSNLAGLRRQIDQALIREMRLKSWRSDLEEKLGAGSVAPN